MKDFYTLADLRDWRPEDPPIRLGVFGDPVAHSFSPRMQNAALAAVAIEMRYAAFHILPNELSEALALARQWNFVGVNLTRPHKIAGQSLMDHVDDFSRQVGAINTVCVADGRLLGSNTDGEGFARAIRQEFSVDLRALRVLVFGAGGGAGSAIAHQCAMENCGRLILVNRTFEKAKELAIKLRIHCRETRVEAIEWNESALAAQLPNIDLVVNASPLGMKRDDREILPASVLAPRLMIYDAVYSPKRTRLLEAAAESSARAANGLSMLLYQGALSFEQWLGRAAPLDAMRNAL